MRKPNYYTLPDAAKQTDVTPNFGRIYAPLISNFIEMSSYA